MVRTSGPIGTRTVTGVLQQYATARGFRAVPGLHGWTRLVAGHAATAATRVPDVVWRS